MYRMIVAMTVVLYGICLSAGRADAHCTRDTVLRIAARIQSANDNVSTLPHLAVLTLQNADEDLRACFHTTRTGAERWGILALHEQARIEVAGAFASEGRLADARILLRSIRTDVRALLKEARGDRHVTPMLVALSRAAASADDLTHNAQRLASMKVAGERVFAWPSIALGSTRSRPAVSSAKLTPMPTPQICVRPNVPATTVRAVEPDTPQIAQQQNISGTVEVIVSLDANSNVTGTRIQSSPSAILNSAALSAARQSKFQTQIRDCKPIPADIIYSVDFSSQ